MSGDALRVRFLYGMPCFDKGQEGNLPLIQAHQGAIWWPMLGLPTP